MRKKRERLIKEGKDWESLTKKRSIIEWTKQSRHWILFPLYFLTFLSVSSLSHTHTLSLSHAHSLFLPPTLKHLLTCSLSLYHKLFFYTNWLLLSHFLTRTNSLSHTLFFRPTFSSNTHTHSLSLSLSRSNTHSFPHTGLPNRQYFLKTLRAKSSSLFLSFLVVVS